MDTVRSPGTRSPVRRILRGAGRLALTLAFMGAAMAIGVAGYDVLATRASMIEGPHPAPLTVVAPQVLRLSDEVTVTRRFTGQFEAAQETALAFEEGGTLAEVLVREGDAVAAGAVVARLDTRLLEAERASLVASLSALEAEAELARRTNDRQQSLLAEGHVTQQRLDETSLRLAQLEASLAEIDAAIEAIDVRLSKAEIRAPFDGRIGARLMDDGAVAGPGAVVVTLLEDAPVRFRVAIAPALAERLEPGAPVRIETHGRSLPARVAELSPDLDAATRARVAFFDLDQAVEAPPSRASGDLVLHVTRTERGAWVPVSALRQGPRGAWTLLVVSETEAGHVVAVEAAEILHLDGERAYVRGSFEDGARYLPAGTHRVVPGETVMLAEAE